jgi:hypothetical protein
VEHLIQALEQLILALGQLLGVLGGLLLQWWLVLLWIAWWLWGVNWQKAWPVLARGAWAPLVLVVMLVALVWSQIAPGSSNFLGLVSLPNFWWQLTATGLLAATALFCGWLQGVMNWTPEDVPVDPPAPVEHAHGHGH